MDREITIIRKSRFPALISRFHKAVSQNQQTVTCWGTGTPLRLLYVDDLGEASVFALELET